MVDYYGFHHYYINDLLYFSRADLRYEPLGELYVPASLSHAQNQPRELFGSFLNKVEHVFTRDEWMVRLTYSF